jgi:hypothetical protein
MAPVEASWVSALGEKRKRRTNKGRAERRIASHLGRESARRDFGETATLYSKLQKEEM